MPNGAPRCDVCPVAEICQARKQDTWRNLPVRSEKKKRKIVDKTVFILLTEDTVALHKRSTSGLLAGMWEFPNVDAKLDKQAAVTQVTGWQAEPLDLLNADKLHTYIQPCGMAYDSVLYPMSENK